MRKLIVAAAVLLAATASAQIAEGDAEWAKRAEGHEGGHALSAHADAAITAYRHAVAQEPNSVEARWKLLRALRFKGAYVATSNDQKRPIYAEAKKEGDAAMGLLDRLLAAKGLKS